MIHPSYADLMKVANDSVEKGEDPIVVSRYSIVHATAKRARQIIDERKKKEQEEGSADSSTKQFETVEEKALSKAVEEINSGKVKIIG